MESINNLRKEFVLNLDVLMPGDIILEHGYKPQSYAIMIATGSHYSHAMLYEGSTIIEATGSGGVFSKVPNRFAVVNKDDLKVLRLFEGLSKDKADELSIASLTLVGSSYNTKQAIRSGLKKKPIDEAGKGQFCSRLVAQCYKKIGIKLVDNVNYCTPADLERSGFLIEVEGAVKKASPEELSHALAPSIFNGHRKNSVTWTSKAKSILKNSNIEVETENDIFNACLYLKNKKIDKAILKAIKKTDYLYFFLKDRNVNSYRYDVDEFGIKAGRNLPGINGEIAKEIPIVKRYAVNFSSYKEFYYEYPSCLFEAMVELYFDLLMISYERLTVIAIYCTKNSLSPELLGEAFKMMAYIDHLLPNHE